MLTICRASLEMELDKVVYAARKLRDAEIDAGACQTRRDYDLVRKREEEYEEARERFLNQAG